MLDLFSRCNTLQHTATHCNMLQHAATLCNSDIVGFTDISSTLLPEKVSHLLDRLYTSFDGLSTVHNVFKVETIGDACKYVRVCVCVCVCECVCVSVCECVCVCV